MGSLRDSKKVEEYQITRLSDGEGQLSEGQIEKNESGILSSYSDVLPAPLETDLPRRLVLRGGFPSGMH